MHAHPGSAHGQHALPCWAPRRVGSRSDEENSNHMDDDSTLITFIESGGEGDSVAQPPVDDPRVGQSEGDFLGDTLLADLAIGSVQSTMSETTEEQADALLGHSDAEMAPATPEVVVAPQLQQPKPKRPSGAERRRRKRQREAGSRSTGETVSGSVTVIPSQTGLPSLASPTAGTRPTEKAIAVEARREVQCATPREEPVATASVAQTTAGGSRKRAFEVGGTPTEVKPLQKKQKPGYAQIVAKSLQVAVVFEDEPTKTLSEEEGRYVRRQIIRQIDQAPLTSQGGFKAYNSGLSQGIYRVTCADLASLGWLRDAASRIEPLEGRRFQVMELAQLHRANRVKVWIPGEKSSPTTLFSRMEKQNVGLRTAEWRILHRVEKPEGQMLILGIDNVSLRKLRELEGKVFLELSQVRFDLPGQGQTDSSV